jgi:BlaI family penicillinase repressor
MSGVHLTKRELDIMSVLWELGEATVAEVRDRVDPHLAYTSISTMIRMLETKGYVGHRPGTGKAHLYFPRINATAAGKSALGRVMDKIYGGSPVELLAHLVSHHRLSDDEIARMRKLLDAPRKRK